MAELAARLEAASDELTGMGADLATYQGFQGVGGGTAVAAALDGAWSGQRERMIRLAGRLTELGAGVRIAGEAYANVDGELRWTH